ncbi:MAG: D-alanyl-D-alanine carboxypeptidase/D-alanyl-D-alanine-endopeptidase [Leptolyngbya sp. Prado105]|jgi:D-alanyl-D-alanine carboxypeptidase/D-alanyl-D-alanine-endopeptidase (penicillin-binding protein 4)|nr:D-alanyl-D-alanine carboxypeptidase/D-alanyl-D-alanine-endopeptidase [Leptolyngbya sp. Prado105]
MSKRRSLKEKVLSRTSQALNTTLAIASISLGIWNQAATAQTPLESAPLSFSVPTNSRFCRSDLESSIASIVNHPRFDTARWGIVIKPIEKATILYQHNPNASLIPASNVKLLTTAAALQIVPKQTRPFENLLAVVNRYSDNDQADALRRRIGGQSAIRNALKLLGVSSNSYAQVDGSGLSRSNRVTPTALVTLLESMFTHEQSGRFYQSLAVAGVNGTLRNRFRNTLVQGNLHGKTGTLRGVRALSGYLDNRNYGTIAFSIVVNQPGQSGQVLAQAIDQIVLQTAQVESCD